MRLRLTVQFLLDLRVTDEDKTSWAEIKILNLALERGLEVLDGCEVGCKDSNTNGIKVLLALL